MVKEVLGHSDILEVINLSPKQFPLQTFYFALLALRKKCRYLELFWPVFSCIRTEYGEYSVSLRIQSECREMQTRITPNMDTVHAVLFTIEKLHYRWSLFYRTSSGYSKYCKFFLLILLLGVHSSHPPPEMTAPDYFPIVGLFFWLWNHH